MLIQLHTYIFEYFKMFEINNPNTNALPDVWESFSGFIILRDHHKLISFNTIFGNIAMLLHEKFLGSYTNHMKVEISRKS